jgi:hypothetical protein
VRGDAGGVKLAPARQNAQLFFSSTMMKKRAARFLINILEIFYP